jgi:hypothetical protein
MKNLKSIFLFTGILVALSVVSGFAQNRDAMSSSAKAAYGIMSEPTNHKANKKVKTKKKYKASKNKHAKTKKDKSPLYRKRSNWAS